MANTQAVSGIMKQVALAAVVDSKTLKAALYLVSATTNGTNASYTATGEVSGTNYSAGGVSVTNANAAGLTSTTAYWTPSASIVYTTVTLATAFDAVMIYSTTDSNRSLGVFIIGSQTITAGTLMLTMPPNDSRPRSNGPAVRLLPQECPTPMVLFISVTWPVAASCTMAGTRPEFFFQSIFGSFIFRCGQMLRARPIGICFLDGRSLMGGWRCRRR